MKTLIPVITEETPAEISARIAKLSATIYRSIGIRDDSPDILCGGYLKNKDFGQQKMSLWYDEDGCRSIG